GMCGKGIVKRAMGLGANVIVCETDPVRAAEAMMDGCRIMKMNHAASEGDIFITATGCKDIITKGHFLKMHDGAILCNAGHFNVEINIDDLKSISKDMYISRNNIQTYVLKDGKALHLLAQGRLVNLASGDGHPVEIMDMSFALQAKCVQYIAANRNLKKGVLAVPKEIDDYVAATLLKTKGISIDRLSSEQKKYISEWIID
ncbi:MAG TPA: adenosylhomocysteinase, partial [Clostridia bacterium]|nr:adenosylhomocysteinase [Clostridia bacterium]